MTDLPEYIYGLRTCRADGSSHCGYVWPESGEVVCTDWRDDDRCGGGLHFLLPGQNDPGVWYGTEANARWLVLRVKRGEYRSGASELAGKSKCRRCEVVHSGTRESAMQWLVAAGIPGPWYYGLVIGGNGATVSGGDGATVSGGDGATLSITWHDGRRSRIAVAYVGEDGIEPNVPYIVKDGRFVLANKTQKVEA